MMDSLTIRLAEPRDREAILTFIARMNFNPRDAITWDRLQMTAMTAWSGERLIGAIPIEPRPIQIRPGIVVTNLHQTTVAVDPDFRGCKIGSQLQNALANAPLIGQISGVFRETPESDAYRWYLKNGFEPAAHIDSYFLDSVATSRADAPLRSLDESDFASIQQRWNRFRNFRSGGFVDQSQRPLREWLTVHPYRARYQFFSFEADDAHAIIGVGKMHSDTMRVDLLDLIGDEQSRKKVLGCVIHAAAQKNWRPIRWPIATSDVESLAIAREFNFQPRWGFDFLIKPLREDFAWREDAKSWQYACIDYI